MDYHALPPHRKTAPLTLTLPDFLTEQQLNRAMQCKSAREVCEKVIQPDLEHIAAKIGQECDAMYLAYMIEHIFHLAGIWR